MTGRPEVCKSAEEWNIQANHRDPVGRPHRSEVTRLALKARVRHCGVL